MSKKIILFADNIVDFLDSRAEFLQNEGFEVLKASSPSEAREILNQRWVHLAILDVRLKDDNDDGDISGLELAQEEAYSSLPKIIMTGFPNVEDVVASLKPLYGELPPAIDYISKDDREEKTGKQVLIEAVKKAFDERVTINWNLEIQWDQRSNLRFLPLANIVQSNMPNEIIALMADELEDLFKRVFYDYKKIRIGKLLWNDQQRFCLPVMASTAEGVTNLRIIVCGERQVIASERKKIKKLAPESVEGIKLLDKAETLHFGANIYGLSGAEIETVEILRDLLWVGKERPLKLAFGHLLENVLSAWHRRGQTNEKGSLISIYCQKVGLSEDKILREDVEQRVESLVRSACILEGVRIERQKQSITFHLPQQPALQFPDPVSMVYDPLISYGNSVVCRMSPGRLTSDNVLVDGKQNTWLTDFTMAGQAPQWWDYICLETAIRFDACQAPDILAWQDFEKCLVKPAALDERLEQNDVIPELRTSIALIEQVRQQASSEAGNDVLPYYAGLLAWAVEAMVHYGPEVLYTQSDRLQGSHLLLAASMLAGRLSEGPSLLAEGGVLNLDKEGTVWLGSQRIVTLMGLESSLLRNLYNDEKVGRLVSREEIAEKVYLEKFDPKDKTQDQRITALFSRLRKKIEPYPDHARYILAVRGGGYRLNVSGEIDD